MSDAGDTRAKNPLGPAGERVMLNVRRLRQRQGLTYKELSSRLEQLGRPIPVLGLSRLEKGDRRVDTDDLVALALALKVTPNALLLPEIEVTTSTSAMPLTPANSQGRPAELWAWATGEVPFGCAPASAGDDEETRHREVLFVAENRPHHSAPVLLQDVVSRLERLDAEKIGGDRKDGATAIAAAGFADALAAGMTTAEARDLAETIIFAALTGSFENVRPFFEAFVEQLGQQLGGQGSRGRDERL